MIKSTFGMSIAVMALLGQVDAVTLHKHKHHHHHHHGNKALVQTRAQGDDTDQFMAESIAEAEKEWEQKKGGEDIFKKQIIQAESAQSLTETSHSEANDVSIKKLTQDIVDGALTSKSAVSYNGNDVQVAEMEDEDTEAIRDQNRKAIKAALKEINGEKQANTTTQAAPQTKNDTQNSTDAGAQLNQKQAKPQAVTLAKAASQNNSQNASSAGTALHQNTSQNATSVLHQNESENQTGSALHQNESANATLAAASRSLHQNDSQNTSSGVSSLRQSTSSQNGTAVAVSQTASLHAKTQPVAAAPPKSEPLVQTSSDINADCLKKCTCGPCHLPHVESKETMLEAVAYGKQMNKDAKSKKQHKSASKKKETTGKKHHHKKAHKKGHSLVQTKDDEDMADLEGQEDQEVMASLRAAEKQMNATMKTPVAYKEHPWSPLHYDVENVQTRAKDDDDINDQDSEDKEIMASLKAAEKQMNTTMKTPVAYKEHAWSPLKYDVENVHLRTQTGEKHRKGMAKPSGLKIIEVTPVAVPQQKNNSNSSVEAGSLVNKASPVSSSATQAQVKKTTLGKPDNAPVSVTHAAQNSSQIAVAAKPVIGSAPVALQKTQNSSNSSSQAMTTKSTSTATTIKNESSNASDQSMIKKENGKTNQKAQLAQNTSANSTATALSQSHADAEQIIDEENTNQNEEENEAENDAEDEEEENEETNENEVEEIDEDEVSNMESHHQGKIYGAAEEKPAQPIASAQQKNDTNSSSLAVKK